MPETVKIKKNRFPNFHDSACEKHKSQKPIRLGVSQSRDLNEEDLAGWRDSEKVRLA